MDEKTTHPDTTPDEATEAKMLRAIEAEPQSDSTTPPEPSLEERLAELEQELRKALQMAGDEAGQKKTALAQAAGLKARADELAESSHRDAQTIGQKNTEIEKLEADKKSADDKVAKFAAEVDKLKEKLAAEEADRAANVGRLNDRLAKEFAATTKAKNRAWWWQMGMAVAVILGLVACGAGLYYYYEYSSAAANVEFYRSELVSDSKQINELQAQLRALKAGQAQAQTAVEESEEAPAETRPAAPAPPKSSEPSSFDEM